MIIDEASFNMMLGLERKRSERTGADFLLVLLNVERIVGKETIGTALKSAIRDTDIVGWYQLNSTIGVIFTTLNGTSRSGIQHAISAKIQNALASPGLHPSFHFFPQGDAPPVKREEKAKTSSDKLHSGLKRMIDILASLAALIVLSPVFLAIAIGIKLTSPGPVLFRQKRLAKNGVEFTFLKFRSMYVKNDPQTHRHYTRDLILGSNGGKKDSVYKIQNDPRVTRFGRILRVTSLDELPQFFNVLVGEMSLVGPRPPIPYEFECYQPWHRRRMEAKPGITGIWQVNGRSRTTFDDMVRMDLQYIRKQSLWLDLKILIKTPYVVVRGDGAF